MTENVRKGPTMMGDAAARGKPGPNAVFLPSNSEPVVDTTTLERIRAITAGKKRLPGETDPVSDLISLFLEDASSRIQAIRSAIASEDRKALRMIAHALRGSCAGIGARAMTCITADIEKTAEADPMDVASALVDSLESEYRRTCVVLEEIRTPGTGDSPTS